MRLYGKKILKNKLNRRVDARRETRDAIVWDVLNDPDNRVCRIKIQGSNELITAHYPFNWGVNPEYVKPGNAVKVNHQGGSRGKIEVVGHGQLVPSPVAGGSTPGIATAPDAILTGLTAHQMPDPDDMRIFVKQGTFRIDGTTYTTDGYVMGASDPMVMGDAMSIGLGDVIITIDPAPPAGYYRLDLISVGIDGIIDYTVGGAGGSNPTAPSVASDHLQVATVLVHGGMTIITNRYIDVPWTAPYLSYVTATMSDDNLDWQSESDSLITVSTFDQYDQPYTRWPASITYALEFVIGNGTLSHAVSATRSEQTTSFLPYAIFTYTRDNGSADISPTLLASALGNYTHYAINALHITLNDGSGEYMD